MNRKRDHVTCIYDKKNFLDTKNSFDWELGCEPDGCIYKGKSIIAVFVSQIIKAGIKMQLQYANYLNTSFHPRCIQIDGTKKSLMYFYGKSIGVHTKFLLYLTPKCLPDRQLDSLSHSLYQLTIYLKNFFQVIILFVLVQLATTRRVSL